jgi:hypothetical protein
MRSWGGLSRVQCNGMIDGAVDACTFPISLPKFRRIRCVMWSWPATCYWRWHLSMLRWYKKLKQQRKLTSTSKQHILWLCRSRKISIYNKSTLVNNVKCFSSVTARRTASTPDYYLPEILCCLQQWVDMDLFDAEPLCNRWDCCMFMLKFMKDAR